MKYLKYLNESIKIEDYKEWYKFFNKELYSKEEEFFKLFPDHDKNYNRIYFPLVIDHEKWNITIPSDLKDYFGWNHIRIIDYYEGLIEVKKSNGGNRRIGIGKFYLFLNKKPHRQ